MFLDPDFDRGVLAGAQGEARVGDVGFDEHGAGRLVEGVGEAGDFGFNGVAGDAFEEIRTGWPTLTLTASSSGSATVARTIWKSAIVTSAAEAGVLLADAAGM